MDEKPGNRLGMMLDRLDAHWRWPLVLFWLGVAAFMLWDRYGAIRIFALSDTDDNMRIMQVRGLLEGQGWYDLQQHRLAGSNIHWSRLVDLPIVALKLIFTPLVGGRIAEQIAVAVAPLLPMLAAMSAVAVIARRLTARFAFLVAIVLLVAARLGQGHVAAATHRPSWLAARHARLGGGGADRPETRPGRSHARPRHGAYR